MPSDTNGFVCVIESPSATDLLNGTTEGGALCSALHLARIPYRYSLTTTLAALAEAIGPRLISAARDLQKLPILHLSMHGNDNGVALTDGTFLQWADLRSIVTPLTNAMQGWLLISMSSCFGTHACRMAMHADVDHPFWVLIGNTGSPTWPDAAVAYITFYHSFFKAVPIEECVRRMCIASGDDSFTILEGRRVKENWAVILQQMRDELLRRLQESSHHHRPDLPLSGHPVPDPA